MYRTPNNQRLDRQREINILNNQTIKQQNEKNEFSAIERSLLFSGPALGAIFGGFIISPLINLFNVRHTITFFCFISALSTLFIPFGEKIFGFWFLCFLRVIQGTCYPAEYVVISLVSRKWATATSTATFLILASTHYQIGSLITMPTAGYFCESNFGWEGIYYLMAILTLIFTIIFFFIFRGCPSEHPWISEVELKQIEFGKTEKETKENKNKKQQQKPPYFKILTDWTIWLLFLGFFCDEIAFQFISELGPYYLNKVLGISIAGTGYFSAIPYLLSLITKLLIGPINDKLLSKIFNEQFRTKLFAAISQYGICISMAGLAFIPLLSSSLWLILPFFSILNIFTGFNFLGFFRYSQKISAKHSELLISWINIVISIVPLILPGIVAAAAPNDTIKQWTNIFLTISILVFISITIFMLFAKSKPRKWALEINNNKIIEEKEIIKQKEENN
uniref:Major facilitator superfamily (MFS) profile domain-containing protein n=1 Tax=Meloidogyne incognita TaxID=6306 RepID=A0A914MIG9_MELIC